MDRPECKSSGEPDYETICKKDVSKRRDGNRHDVEFLQGRCLALIDCNSTPPTAFENLITVVKALTLTLEPSDMDEYFRPLPRPVVRFTRTPTSAT